MGHRLNPLTVGWLEEDEGGPRLALRSFAPGRSYTRFSVARAQDAQAFDRLSDWLAGHGGDEPPFANAAIRAGAFLSGLLVFDEELARMPGTAAPAFGDARAVAGALDPGIAAFLAAEPRLTPLSPALADDLAERGFVELPVLLEAGALQAVRRFYRTLSEGGWTRPENGREGRRVIHNDPVARHILEAMTPVVAALARAPLKPSYAYAAEYGPGHDLKPHTDRPQCEYTVSVFLDHRPAPADDVCPWPLTIHAPQGDVVMRQPAGGGPLFRGRELPHSRPPLPDGQQSQMLFLHYVPADFAGALD